MVQIKNLNEEIEQLKNSNERYKSRLFKNRVNQEEKNNDIK